MYLRNKKTGEVVDWSFVGPTAIKEYEGKDILLERERYESIEEFISEWEDYVPKEPLIRDEKIRKAVRAWAEANNVAEVNYYKSSHYWYLRAFDDYERGIDFWLWYNDGKEQELIENKKYTIAELCGEEE